MLQDITEDAINELAVKASEGDDEAMARLVTVIMPSAKARATKLNSDSSRISDDDLTQEGMLGFLDAVRNFDISKGVPFTAYANRCIRNQIINALRANSNSGNAALSTAVSIEDDEHGLPAEDPAAIVDSQTESERIFSIVDSELTEFEKKVLFRRLAGDNYSSVASSLGCSVKAVDNAVQRTRKKIKAKL